MKPLNYEVKNLSSTFSRLNLTRELNCMYLIVSFYAEFVHIILFLELCYSKNKFDSKGSFPSESKIEKTIFDGK